MEKNEIGVETIFIDSAEDKSRGRTMVGKKVYDQQQPVSSGDCWLHPLIGSGKRGWN